MPPNRSCVLPLTSCGRPARSALNRSKVRSSSGSTLYLAASIRNSRCSSASFFGFSFARSRACVQSVFVSYSSQTSSSKAALVRADPRNAVPGYRRPSLVVDAAVAEHLEVLRFVPVRRFGVVEGVHHAEAFERRLLDAVDDCRMGESGGFEDRRRDVDHMMELAADLAFGLDAVRPMDDRAVPRAAPVRRDLLGPLVGRVHRVSPAHRVVVVGVRAAELVDLRLQELGRLERAHAVQRGHLVEAAVGRAFGRGAVVADDQIDQRVVEHVRDL